MTLSYMSRPLRLAGVSGLVRLALGHTGAQRASAPQIEAHRLRRTCGLPHALFGRYEPTLRPPHHWSKETPT